MTTVAYRDGQMAADSKSTDETGAFVTRCNKIYRLPSGGLLGCAGDVDARDIVKMLGAVRAEKSLPSRAELAATKCDFAGILVLKNGSVFYVDVGIHETESESIWYGSVIEVRERVAAVGSGHKYALGAMAAGMDAERAVTIACRYDSFSMPPVRVEVLKPASKKPAA